LQSPKTTNLQYKNTVNMTHSVFDAAKPNGLISPQRSKYEVCY